MNEFLANNEESQKNLGSKRASDAKHVPTSTENIKKQSINEDGSYSQIENHEKRLSHKNGQLQETIRKCLRKGSRICYADLENITVLRRIPEKEDSKISCDSDVGKDKVEKVDSYRSGESLFKTFTFEQTRDIDDPETIKCIEFWKSVMKKNLAPIKCTLLENTEKPIRKSKSNTPSLTEKKVGSTESIEKKKKCNFLGDGAKIWSEALKEIRKKKLDELKLYMRDRCQYCKDPFTKELTDQMGTETKEEQHSVIVSLNAWKPPESRTDLTHDSNKSRSSRSRLSTKIKTKSASQTIETRMNEKSSTPRVSVGINEPTDKYETPRKNHSALKNSTSNNMSNEGSKKTSEIHITSTSVQVPNIKCACESKTCICPHKMAVNNSMASFIEIARTQNLQKDESTEKFFPNDGEACICRDHAVQPWNQLICTSEPCPAKQRVSFQESSSDFNLNRLIGTSEECICTKMLNVSCPSSICKNKGSQGSLIEGLPSRKEDKNDPCPCSDLNSDAICKSDVCPTKTLKKFSTTCVCGANEPWSQAVCQSWACPHRPKIKIKRVESEEKITFKGHPPIRKTCSTCKCSEKSAWNEVNCQCKTCEAKCVNDPPLKREKSSSLKVKSRSNSKDLEIDEKFVVKEPKSNQSLEKISKEIKVSAATKDKKCVCSSAPPWNSVKCPQKCCIKDEDHSKNKLSINVGRVSVANKEQCICKDGETETICRAYKCENREKHVEYPVPCLCPKDAEPDFECSSPTCKMKKIDKTCVCRLEQDAQCDAKTCKSKPIGSKRLTPSKKPLRYDTMCICRVRGLPTTEEVSCSASKCPFKKKYPKNSKKKIPRLYTPVVEKNIEVDDDITKCICDKDITSIRCRSSECKKKKSDQTIDCYDQDNEQEICICKNELEFMKNKQVCGNVQCPKTYTAEHCSINDKCVCTNSDDQCIGPMCHSADNEIQSGICSGMMVKKQQKYCYICGHYDCGSNKKICEEN